MLQYRTIKENMIAVDKQNKNAPLMMSDVAPSYDTMILRAVEACIEFKEYLESLYENNIKLSHIYFIFCA